MKWRWFLIVSFLFFRFILGWIETVKYINQSWIIVTGNIDNIYQNNSECIIVVGRFWVNSRNNCLFSRTDKVKIVGNVYGGVIDRFFGRLWLDSAEIIVLKGNENDNISMSMFMRIFGGFRENIVNVYRRSLPEPESGLVAGIILGYKNDIGQKFYEEMIKSGTIHIAVASGYNIMLVGGTILSVCFWFLKRKWASLFAVVAMLFYAFEAGGEPPVVRAVIMASVVFLAAILGRKTLSWWVLLVTGWVMVLFEPYLLVNVSFQLSMAASVGLMVVEPMINKWLNERHEKTGNILEGSGVLASLSTMVVTAPIIWWHFGRMSLIGIVSNILILPFVPILMIFGSLMQVLPGLFYWPTYVLSHWIVGVIRFFGN